MYSDNKNLVEKRFKMNPLEFYIFNKNIIRKGINKWTVLDKLWSILQKILLTLNFQRIAYLKLYF